MLTSVTRQILKINIFQLKISKRCSCATPMCISTEKWFSHQNADFNWKIFQLSAFLSLEKTKKTWTEKKNRLIEKMWFWKLFLNYYKCADWLVTHGYYDKSNKEKICISFFRKSFSKKKNILSWKRTHSRNLKIPKGKENKQPGISHLP